MVFPNQPFSNNSAPNFFRQAKKYEKNLLRTSMPCGYTPEWCRFFENLIPYSPGGTVPTFCCPMENLEACKNESTLP